jgi:hypothetical protein
VAKVIDAKRRFLQRASRDRLVRQEQALTRFREQFPEFWAALMKNFYLRAKTQAAPHATAQRILTRAALFFQVPGEKETTRVPVRLATSAVTNELWNLDIPRDLAEPFTG